MTRALPIAIAILLFGASLGGSGLLGQDSLDSTRGFERVRILGAAVEGDTPVTGAYLHLQGPLFSSCARSERRVRTDMNGRFSVTLNLPKGREAEVVVSRDGWQSVIWVVSPEAIASGTVRGVVRFPLTTQSFSIVNDDGVSLLCDRVSLVPVDGPVSTEESGAADETQSQMKVRLVSDEGGTFSMNLRPGRYQGTMDDTHQYDSSTGRVGRQAVTFDLQLKDDTVTVTNVSASAPVVTYRIDGSPHAVNVIALRMNDGAWQLLEPYGSSGSISGLPEDATLEFQVFQSDTDGQFRDGRTVLLGSRLQTAVEFLPKVIRRKIPFEVRSQGGKLVPAAELFLSLDGSWGVRTDAPLGNRVRRPGPLARTAVIHGTIEAIGVGDLMLKRSDAPQIDCWIRSSRGAFLLSDAIGREWEALPKTRLHVAKLSTEHCVCGVLEKSWDLAEGESEGFVILEFDDGAKRSMRTIDGAFCILLEEGEVPVALEVHRGADILTKPLLGAGIVEWCD